MSRREIMQNGLHAIIIWLEEHATELPSLPDISDMDMAIMYLRHIEKHLETE